MPGARHVIGITAHDHQARNHNSLNEVGFSIIALRVSHKHVCFASRDCVHATPSYAMLASSVVAHDDAMLRTDRCCRRRTANIISSCSRKLPCDVERNIRIPRPGSSSAADTSFFYKLGSMAKHLSATLMRCVRHARTRTACCCCCIPVEFAPSMQVSGCDLRMQGPI